MCKSAFCAVAALIAGAAWCETAASGALALEGWNGGYGFPATVEIRQGLLTIQTVTVTLGPGGSYSVPLLTPITPGTYDVTVKTTHWLRSFTSGVTVPGGQCDPTLANGDADGNNAVDLYDLSAVLVDFGTSNFATDLDGSGVVDLYDLNTVLINFGLVGADASSNDAVAPLLDGLAGNGRALLAIDAGVAGNPFAPYHIYRKTGSDSFVFHAETVGHLWVDQLSVQNGTTYRYKVRAVGRGGEEGPESAEVALTPSSENPVCEATFATQDGVLTATVTSPATYVDSASLSADGEYVASTSPNTFPAIPYDVQLGRNGDRSFAVVVWDQEGRTGCSAISTQSVANDIQLVSLNRPELNPDNPGESVIFSGRFAAPHTWRVEIRDEDTDALVLSAASATPTIAFSYLWDGTVGGVGVEDSTYRFTVFLTDLQPQKSSKGQRMEVSRSGLGCRALIVNTIPSPNDPLSVGYKIVSAIRSACKRVGLTYKVMNPGNAFWEDYGPIDNPTPGIASYLQSSALRMVYINAHGTHRMIGGSYVEPGTSFVAHLGPLAQGARLDKATGARITKNHVHQLWINPKKLRLIWLDACGSGRQCSNAQAQIKYTNAWKDADSVHGHDLGAEFGIRAATTDLPSDTCFYLGYFGTSHPNQPYVDMVRLFFERFSESGGTSTTIAQIMPYLETLSILTANFNGDPFFDMNEDHWWLTDCPPVYNIRVFTDTWYGYGPYYGGLHMADMR